MPLVSTLTPVERDYVSAFGIRAVGVSNRGQVFVSDNPHDASREWWASVEDARRVCEIAFETGDVEGAAKILGVRLTKHADLLKRLKVRTDAIKKVLDQAQRDGTLQQFNAEYRRRRLAHAGQPFMSYGEAHRRLRRVIADSIANGGTIPPSFAAAVFDEARPSP